MITYPTNKLQKVLLSGGCQQNGTPTPNAPIDIVCNNGAVKVDNQGNIYTQGTQEVVTDNLGNTANAERLLGVGNYKDVQSVLDGSVTRNVGIKVLDGTEGWTKYSASRNLYYNETIFSDVARGAPILTTMCTHYQATNANPLTANTCRFTIQNQLKTIDGTRFYMDNESITSESDFANWLADQYANGTPVIVVYPLATATTEQVTPQPLAGNSVTQTAGSINNLPIESSTIAELKKRYIGDNEVKRVYIGDNLVWKNN